MTVTAGGKPCQSYQAASAAAGFRFMLAGIAPIAMMPHFGKSKCALVGEPHCCYGLLRLSAYPVGGKMQPGRCE